MRVWWALKVPAEPKCPPGVCQSDGFVLVQIFPRKTFHTGSGWAGLRSLACAMRARGQQRIVRSPIRKKRTGGEGIRLGGGQLRKHCFASVDQRLPQPTRSENEAFARG